MDNNLNIIEKNFTVENGALTWVNPNLKKFVIPDGVVKIADGVFQNSKISTIVIPESVKIIGYDAFCGSSLKKVKLPSKLLEIKSYAFEDTKINSVEILGSPQLRANSFRIKTLDKIVISDTVAFYTYSTGELATIFSGENPLASIRRHITITIKYTNCETLLNFIKRLRETFCYSLVLNISFSFKLEGIELSETEQNMIRKTIFSYFRKDKKIKIQTIKFKFKESIEEKEISSDTDKDSSMIVEEANDEIRKINESDVDALLEDIIKLLEGVTNKNIIVSKVNSLLEEYIKDREEVKPKYEDIDKSELVMSLDKKKDIKIVKLQLILALNGIKQNLTIEKNSLDFLNSLNEYKKILDSNIDELPKENTNIQDKIKSIIYFSNYLSLDKKEQIVKLLQDNINKFTIMAEKRLSEKLENSMELVVEENLELNFNVEVSKLYDDLFERVNPYLNLLEALKQDEFIEYTEDNDIKSTIGNTKYLISKLSNSQYKEGLNKAFGNIIDKYLVVINDIIQGKNEEKNTPSKIEKQLRSELIPILNSLNRFANLDSYEKNNTNSVNILSQLYICLEILKTEGNINLDKEKEQQVITSLVIDVHNKIINEIEDKETRSKFKDELTESIKQAIKKLEEKDDITSIRNYTKETMKILKSIVKTNLRVDGYINKMNEFHKYTK